MQTAQLFTLYHTGTANHPGKLKAALNRQIVFAADSCRRHNKLLTGVNLYRLPALMQLIIQGDLSGRPGNAHHCRSGKFHAQAANKLDGRSTLLSAQ